MPTRPGLLLSMLLLLASGCGWVSAPNWLHPGPAPYQRHRAVEFDPYPDDDLGPPVVGGRPLGYQNPKPEPARSRQQTGLSGWWRWPAR